jgi:DNA-directed RNA polymerase specialized sigma24 family protein
MEGAEPVVTREASPEVGSFEEFFYAAEPRLRRALVAAYGVDRGREAAAESLAWAWEHWSELIGKANPVGYVYRIGVRRTRFRRMPVTYVVAERPDPWFEPKLHAALEALTKRQRTAVVLVHGFGWQLQEVAEVTGIAVTTVQSHLDRGMAKLRLALEVDSDE